VREKVRRMTNERRKAGWSRGLLHKREQDGKIPFAMGKLRPY
jgi:hypothetical protein